MLRTIPILERGISDAALPPITVPDSIATDVFPDTTDTTAGPINPLTNGEATYIEMFNVGPNNAYFAINRKCDNQNNFNGYIIVGQAYSVPTRQRISVFSVGGTKIARTFLTRTLSL